MYAKRALKRTFYGNKRQKSDNVSGIKRCEEITLGTASLGNGLTKLLRSSFSPFQIFRFYKKLNASLYDSKELKSNKLSSESHKINGLMPCTKVYNQ